MSKARDLADGTFDTDTLVVDAGNNRVGVGTASPQSPLHLHETTYPEIRLTNSTTGSTGSDGVNIQVAGTTQHLYIWNNENAATILGTNNTERLRIDSSGRVTMPSQPSFEAYRTVGNITTSNTTIVFNGTRHNIGNHYNTSTGYFTAPVAGTYIFTTQAFTNGSSSGIVDIQVNGSSRVRMEADTNVSYRSMFASGIFSLSVNDVVRIWCISQPIHYNTSGLYSNFCGYLLG